MVGTGGLASMHAPSMTRLLPGGMRALWGGCGGRGTPGQWQYRAVFGLQAVGHQVWRPPSCCDFLPHGHSSYACGSTPRPSPGGKISGPGRRDAKQHSTLLASKPVSSPPLSLVFFGTPPVAARVLERLWARQNSHNLRVVGVVTQPPRPRGRGRQVAPSAVEAAASCLGLDSSRLLTPASASDPAFATLLREELRPDVCLTAAYGQYLPSRVLSAPLLGTLNLHPSLLPLYRGAAPVQRALLDGRARSGCSVLFSVREMDAGPLWAQQAVGLGEVEDAEELQGRLLNLGLDAFLERLPALRAFGSAQEAMEKGCQQQDHAAATHAPKLRACEAEVDFLLPARSVHWSVRALQGWPGAFARVEVERFNGRGWEPRVWKILRSSMVGQEEEEQVEGARACSEPNLEKSEITRLLSSPLSPPAGTMQASSARLRVRCGDGRWLQLEEWVEGGKRAVKAAAFLNGLGHSAGQPGRRVRWAPDPDWRSGM